MKYIDTSAFIKGYSTEAAEKGSRNIKDLISQAKRGEETLISSILLIGESVSVFDKWVRLKLLTEEDFLKTLFLFVADIKDLNKTGGLILETINPNFILLSTGFIIKHHIPINDTIHLHTALTWKSGIKEFICSDKMLIEAAEKEGLKTFNPEK